ncbi:MAG: LysE family transporter [Candidatus Moraniibacteriota bacterium]|nr:MAG: LysE family transporter [Candidatus Moranbacteria bacterium]
MEYFFPAITIGIIAFLAAVSPGPDFIVVAKNSLNARKIGLMTALGVGLGILVHVAYSLLGIGLIISQSIILFSIIKYVGAAYLLYLGIQLVRTKKESFKEISVEKGDGNISLSQALKEGFITNALNPKATLFFLSIFTQVIDVKTPLIVQGMYGIEIAFIVGIWFSLLAFIISAPLVRNKFSKVQYYLSKIMGVALVAFGIKLALQNQK